MKEAKTNQEIVESLQEIDDRIYPPAAQLNAIAVLIEATSELELGAEVGPGLSILLERAAKDLLAIWEDLKGVIMQLDHGAEEKAIGKN